jgi:CRP-like cAMP-binding protein
MPVELETLRSLPLLRGLDSNELEEVAAHLALRDVPASTEIIREGEDSAHALYFLLQGSVDVVKRGMDGRGRVISSLSAPSVFGEVEALSHRKAIASVLASSSARFAVLHRGVFDEMCAANRSSALKIIRNLAQVLSYRLAATDDKLAAQFALEAPTAKEIHRVIFSDWREKP